jgi:hypothetical protein
MNEIFCHKCGTQNASNMVFCSNCGQKLIANENLQDMPDDLPQTVMSSQPAQTQSFAEPAPTVFSQSQQQQFSPPQFSSPPFEQNFLPQNINQVAPVRHKAVAITAFIFSLISIFLFIFYFAVRHGMLFFWLAVLLWGIGFALGLAATILRFTVSKHFGGRAFAISSIVISLITSFIIVLYFLRIIR